MGKDRIWGCAILGGVRTFVAELIGDVRCGGERFATFNFIFRIFDVAGNNSGRNVCLRIGDRRIQHL